MDTKFSTICEDESTDEIGDLFVTMWRQCGEGNFTLVTNALAREFVRHEVLSQSVGLDGGDEMDEEDEEDTAIDHDRGEAMVMDRIQECVEECDEEEAAEALDAAESGAMTVDPDGWETVHRGKSKKKTSKR